jgi:two-component system OmpR family sensor kinase
MTLRNRLLASYIVLLTVTLGIMAFALLLLLDAQPAPREPTYSQLFDKIQELAASGSLLQQDLLTGFRRGDFEYLQSFADDNSVRVMIVNLTNRTVMYDSAHTYEQGEQLPVNIDDLASASTLTRPGGPARAETVFGDVRNPNGDTWLFAGFAINRDRPIVDTRPTLLIADTQPTQSLQDSLRQFGGSLIRPLFGAAIVGGIVAIVLAALISRSIARPLQTLVAAIHRVTAGNLELQVPVSGPPEVRAVAEGVNQMSAKVLVAQQAQRDFLANVSHDLKTPLTSIQGFSQAIIDGAARDPKHAASIIYDEAERMNRMVVELTDLARIQAGRLSLKSTAIDISQIASAVTQRLSVVAQQKGIKMQIDTPAMPPIAGDGDRLAQVLNNLIGNAIKYTPSGGSVYINTRVNLAVNGVEVVVRDTGVGIPQEDLPRIFERFYQVDKVRGPERGTGLGLAITREIVEAHGGRISVTSDGEFKGSTFTVWLPSPQMTTVLTRKRS